MEMRALVKFDVHAEKTSFERYIKLWFFHKGEAVDRQLKPIAFEVTTVDDRSMCPDPTLEIDRRTAQNLMDALWSAGLRPNNGEGMDAQVTAIKAHLEDMRTLVFKDKPAK